MRCRLVAIPIEDGAGRMGCEMGPSAFRTAGLQGAIAALGHEVLHLGTVLPAEQKPRQKPPAHPNAAIKSLARVSGWISAISEAAFQASSSGAFPIFLGGDHSLSAGSVAGLARRARALDRPLFVLWLDAHADFHRLETTQSGNLHGVPLAYVTGQSGFEGYFPPLEAPVDPQNVCVMGLRSVDGAERRAVVDAGVTIFDMRAIDEHGMIRLLGSFLDRVEAANGLLHVSLDVDFLDPAIAPAVGTTVPGGATYREAHLAMELLHDRGLVTSLDLVELNPFLDERGRTATLMVDLTASLLGRRIIDRPTRSY